MNFDWTILIHSFPDLLTASILTIKYTLISGVLGSLLALLITWGLTEGSTYLKYFLQIYLYFFRGSPLIVQIFLIYYGSGQFSEELTQIGLWIFFKEAWFCALLSLTLNTAAYTSYILKGSLDSIPYGEKEAALSLGFSSNQAYWYIHLSRAIGLIIPAFGNEIILLLKATSLVSTITLIDLLGEARRIASDTFAPIEVFIAAGLIYLFLTSSLTLLFSRIEKNLNPARHK